MEINPVGHEDTALLLSLMRAVQEDDPWSVRFEEERARAAVEKLLANPGFGQAWLVREDGRAVGHAVMSFDYSLEYGGRNAWVDELTVLDRGQLTRRFAHRLTALGKTVPFLIRGFTGSLTQSRVFLLLDKADGDVQELVEIANQVGDVAQSLCDVGQGGGRIGEVVVYTEELVVGVEHGLGTVVELGGEKIQQEAAQTFAVRQEGLLLGEGKAAVAGEGEALINDVGESGGVDF